MSVSDKCPQFFVQNFGQISVSAKFPFTQNCLFQYYYIIYSTALTVRFWNLTQNFMLSSDSQTINMHQNTKAGKSIKHGTIFLLKQRSIGIYNAQCFTLSIIIMQLFSSFNFILSNLKFLKFHADWLISICLIFKSYVNLII